jgi:hypothetical protein
MKKKNKWRRNKQTKRCKSFFGKVGLPNVPLASVVKGKHAEAPPACLSTHLNQTRCYAINPNKIYV